MEKIVINWLIELRTFWDSCQALCIEYHIGFGRKKISLELIKHIRDGIIS